MKPERYEQVLSAGFNSAREQMEINPSRPEYPHSYSRLYAWLEEKLFNLYEAMRLRKHQHVRTMSGEIIVTASEVAEYADHILNNIELQKEEDGV